MAQRVPIQQAAVPQLVGARIRALREASALLQEDLAAQARRLGFDWARGTVAMIEAGRRRLSVEEFLCLPQILEGAGAGVLKLEDLFPDGGYALLNPLAATGVDVLRAVLRGDAMGGEWWHAAAAGPVSAPPPVPGTETVRKYWSRWAPTLEPDPATVYRVALASRGDVELKAARAFRVPAAAVALAAEMRWNRSLTEERDRRFQEKWKAMYEPPGPTTTEVSPRFVQGLKGHITRKLLEELEPLVKDIKRKKRRAR